MRSSVAACIALHLLGPIPALAYMKFGVQVGNRQVELKWAAVARSLFRRRIGALPA